jgi:hypothetical protein
MKITINDNRKIYAIQEEFNQKFPFLKIEFYSKAHTLNGTPSKKIVKHGNKTIGECRTEHNKGEISISGEMTIADLKQRFGDVYGLSIRILRKSENDWVDTNISKGLTINLQNENGKENSKKTID